jgi:hypothetical protein
MKRIRVYAQWVLVLAACLALLTSCTWKEVEVQLRFKPQMGDAYKVQMVAEQQISQTLEGETMDVVQTIGMGFTYNVTEVDANGNAWVDVVYDSARLDQSSPSGDVSYDSANPPEEVPPGALGFSALVGKGFRMKISPEGEIIEVTGLDTMINDMLDDMGITDEALLEQLRQSISEQYDADAMREQMGNTVINYPDGPVRIGDTWTETTTSGGQFPVQAESVYTLQEYQDGIATIGMTSTVSINPNAEPQSIAGMELVYNLSGEQEGVMLINVETGWTAGATITQTMSGDMTISSGGTDMTIPMSIFSVINLEMEKEEAQ